MKDEIIKYAKGLGAKDTVLKWLEQRVDEEKNQGEVEHIVDYLVSNKAPKKLDRATYKQMKENTDKWVKELNKKANKITETEKDTEVVLDFKDGFKFVRLIGENAYAREGLLMKHCVQSYFGKDDEIYSLRDKDNNPHCTISKQSQQIKGKGNGSINPKYISYVVKFLKYLKIDVRASEMQNLGYYNVSKYKKYLNDETKNNLFNKKYWFKENKLKDKNNNTFYCFEMLNQLPLITETKIGVKINFNLPAFIKGSIEFLYNITKNKISSGDSAKIGSSGYSAKIGSSGDSAQIGSSGDSAQIGSSGDSAKIGSSGNSAQIGSSGNSAQIGSSGDSAQIGSSGNSAKIGSSGYSAKIGSSGNYAKIGSSGNSAKIGSSGYSAQIGSSGNSAKIGSSGYSAKIGSSGNYAKIGSSGNSAKIGSSGDSAQIGSSGDSAQIGSSGDYTQIEVKGHDTVCSAIGINSQIKGEIGTWITLAEYDISNKPIFVKSAKIDGKKLKNNVWYKLKNKRIIEVE